MSGQEKRCGGEHRSHKERKQRGEERLRQIKNKIKNDDRLIGGTKKGAMK